MQIETRRGSKCPFSDSIYHKPGADTVVTYDICVIPPLGLLITKKTIKPSKQTIITKSLNVNSSFTLEISIVSGRKSVFNYCKPGECVCINCYGTIDKNVHREEIKEG